MTPEQRLDRLERIAKLMVKAGLRARRQSREQDEKINILIDRQIKTGEAIAALTEVQAKSAAEIDEKINILMGRQIKDEERQARTDERIDRLVENQVRSDERLNRLVETVDRYISERRNGNP